jgi:hypothetical protein
MGIFNLKGASSRAALFNMNRRLSGIAEEEGSDVSLEDSGRKQEGRRKSIVRNTPNKNKNTPNRPKHRFHKLVELDYGDGGDEKEEGYSPPQDFLQTQRKHEQDFYRNGPKNSEIVEVSNSTNLEGAINANTKRNDTSSDSCSMPSQPEPGTVKIFQFAADTASLSASFSSDSSVHSSNASFRQIYHPGNKGVEAKDKPAVVPLFKDSPKQSADVALFQNNFVNVAKSITFPPTKNTQRNNRESKLHPKLNAVFKAQDRSVFSNKSSSPASSRDMTKTLTIPAPTKVNQEEFFATDFNPFSPNEATRDANNDNMFKAEALAENSSDSQWESQFAKPKQMTLPSYSKTMNSNQGSNSRPDTQFAKAESLFQETENLFKRNQSLFKEGRSPFKENDRKPKRFRSSPYEAESPLKENENNVAQTFDKAGFGGKKFEVERNTLSPMDKPERTRGFASNRPLSNRENVSVTAPNIEAASSFTTEKLVEICTNVNLKYNNTPDTFRGCDQGPTFTRADSRHKPSSRLPQKRRTQAPSKAYLGAAPMTSPNSMHLFLDKSSSYDDTVTKESFVSTIDSYDSNSTTSSHESSTVADPSPRGIRGGFPSDLVVSSTSTSTASTNLLNDIDYGPADKGFRRPPTGVPPTSILGSMLFQAGGEQDAPAPGRPVSPKRQKVRGVPQAIHANESASSVSDVTGSTASDWMIQSNKLLNRYYYNSRDGVNQKKHNISRQLRRREEKNLEEFQSMMVGIQKERRKQEHQRQHQSVTSGFSDDPVVAKMRRHQHKFQYLDSRPVRSGFDNENDDDTVSLFEA